MSFKKSPSPYQDFYQYDLFSRRDPVTGDEREIIARKVYPSQQSTFALFTRMYHRSLPAIRISDRVWQYVLQDRVYHRLLHAPDPLLDAKPSREEARAAKLERKKNAYVASLLISQNVHTFMHPFYAHPPKYFTTWKDKPKVGVEDPNSGEIFEVHEPLTPEDKCVNRFVFQNWLGRQLDTFLTRKSRVIDDYMFIATHRDPQDLDAVIQRYKGFMLDFVYHNSIRGVDSDEHYQESLITLWKCVEQYQARGFSTFLTYFKQALKNKSTDLLRKMLASRRRMNREAIPMGLQPQDTPVAWEAEKTAFEGWLFAQRTSEDPFETLSMPELIALKAREQPENVLSLDVLTHDRFGARREYPEVTEENFPHFGEHPMETYYEAPQQARIRLQESIKMIRTDDSFDRFTSFDSDEQGAIWEILYQMKKEGLFTPISPSSFPDLPF